MLNWIKMLMLMMFFCLFFACGGGGAGSGDDGDAPASCDGGCLIADVCYTDGETNPENPCLVCSVSNATDGWSDNDGASCDDGDFCTTGDSCLAGFCSESSGSPCGAGEICLEDEDACCLSGIPQYLACNGEGDVASYDECGEELGVVEDCRDLNGSCSSGICGCVPGWTGDDCDQCVVYVNQATGDNTNTGRSWDQALATVQAGIYAAAADHCQVWMAAGTYYPTVEAVLGDPRSRTVSLTAGLALYGGFGGFETAAGQRDPAQYETLISGDIGTLGDSADNAYHVVTGADGCVLDGITISGGNADVTVTRGGGLTLSGGTMTVADCVFDNNQSSGSGGGIYVEDGELTISGSRFTGNESDNGGGVLCRNGLLAIDGSAFSGNEGYGGAIASQSCDCTMTNSRFLENNSLYWGGAISFTAAGSSLPTSNSSITNCAFINNRSGSRGGAIAVFGEQLSALNCTFALNRAEDAAGGIYIGAESNVTLANTILWANGHPDTGEGSQIGILDGTSSVAIGTSLIEGGCAAVENATCSSGNVSGDPRFIDARAGDVRLRFDSWAIDRGDDDLAPALDIAGLPRDASSDIGAHEHDAVPRLIWAYGQGAAVTAVFSEPVFPSAGGATFTLSGGPAAVSSVIHPSASRAEITLDTPLASDGTYTLSAAGVEDASGTAVAGTASTDVVVYGDLVNATFNDNLLPGWHSVDDAGATTNAPSDWAVADQVLCQRSNIYGESGDARYGTRMLMQAGPGVWPQWTNYVVSADIVNGDNDGLGLVFRHHGENLYYKVDLDSQRSFTRVYKVHQNTHTILAESPARPYVPDTPFNLKVEVHNAEMWVFIDNLSVFDHPVIDETTTDGGGNSGIAGLYTWGSGDGGDVVFDNVRVSGH